MKRSLPTLHEIIEQQKKVIRPDIAVPVVASDIMVQATEHPEAEPVHIQAAPKFQQGEAVSIFYPEFSSSNNAVLRPAWQKALLQYFNAKINNA